MTTQKKRTIGKYRLVEELASGAFGRVYRAEDTSRKNRSVALKVMHTAHLDSTQERESFLREAQFLKLLEHSYILPILDADIEDEFPYLVTEYAPNGSLHDRLKKQAPRPLTVQETLDVLAQIGEALAYAHQQNIIHRDLKPANILFNADGNALLADFGIATVLATSVRSGTAVGTPSYMAPEQFRGTASKEADQYSLGCIAYELLTGRVPFTAPDFFALGYKHMHEKPIQPSQLNLLIPRSIEDAILKAMAKQRADRHANIDAFMHALGIKPPIFAPAVAHVDMPESVQGWVTAFSDDEANEEEHGIAINEREEPGAANAVGESDTMSALRRIASEESESPFEATASGINGRVEEETGKTPAVARMKSSTPFVTRKLAAIDAIALEGSAKEDVEEGIAEEIDATALPATLFVTQEAVTPVPDITASTPDWAKTTNIPGSFSPTTPQNRKRHPLNSSRGLVIMASLVAVLLILLSGGIYVLLETPYPKTIAAAIKTHTIAKLLTIPTAVPTAQPTVKPTAHPKPKPTQQAKTTTSTSSSTTTTPVQVVVNNSPSHGNNPTGGGSASPTPQPAHASVAITPATTTANQQFTVDAVVGSPSASEAQARVITATGQQGFTVTATGQGTVAASATTGTLTLFNNTTAPVTVAAGTTISTNDNTVAFTTQQAATVPVPATGQQWGTTNVSVVAQVAGTTGNIAQYAIDAQCCLSAGTVYAINEVAFSGGQNAQTYTYLQQSDIDNAAAPLITSLESSVPASMTSQIRSNEQLIGNVNCVPTVATVSSANSQVASTNGTVSVTCTQEVYDVQGAQRVAAALLQQQESNAGYALTSQVSTGIVGASIIDNQGTVAVVVNTGATARYVFTTARLQQIASMIAGKSLSQVKSILTGMTGVANSVVLLTGGNGTTLPTNVSQITVTAS